MAVAGKGLAAVGDIRQGNANENVADYNAQVANQNADLVQSQGAEQARLAQLQADRVIGGMRAAYGASGVTSDGSAADVIRNSAANAELQQLTIKNAADIKSTALRNEASLDYYRASNDRVAGYMNAASDIIGGGGKMAMMSGGGGNPTGYANGVDGSASADLSIPSADNFSYSGDLGSLS